MPALRAYNEGLALTRAGEQHQGSYEVRRGHRARSKFCHGIFASLAQTYASLGYDDKAEQASRRAVSLSDNLSAQDRYLIEANHASIMHDTAKAIAAYENLTKVNPDDTRRAVCAGQSLRRRQQSSTQPRSVWPWCWPPIRRMSALCWPAAGSILKRAMPQAALDPLNKALSLAIQFDNQEQKGAILQAMGIAYQDLNKPDDALRNYQQALEIRQEGRRSTWGRVHPGPNGAGAGRAGQFQGALASYQEAIDVDRKIGDKAGLARDLMNLGSLYHDHGKYNEAS